MAGLRLESAEPERALKASHMAWTLAAELRGRRGREVLGDALHFVAAAHFGAGDHDRAAAVVREGEATFARGGCVRGQARMRLLAADMGRERLCALPEPGDPQAARSARRLLELTTRKAEGALRLARASADARLLAQALCTLGHLYLLEGGGPQTLEAAGESVELFRQCGDALGEVGALLLASLARRRGGDLPGAREACNIQCNII